jgi:hypothetical protein
MPDRQISGKAYDSPKHNGENERRPKVFKWTKRVKAVELLYEKVCRTEQDDAKPSRLLKVESGRDTASNQDHSKNEIEEDSSPHLSAV